MNTITEQCRAAFESTFSMRTISTTIKNQALTLMAEAVWEKRRFIIEENQRDLDQGQANDIGAALLDRLKLDDARIKDIAASFLSIRDLKDPVGEVVSGWRQPNGIDIRQVRVPFGAIAMIYEARPNVTADAIALAIKSGNAVVLRGSSTAEFSNRALSAVLSEAAYAAGVPKQAIQLLDDLSREGIHTLITQRAYLSLVIPRGGSGLIQYVVQHATVPSIETGIGNCHVYIDVHAQIEKAIAIAVNSKTHRPSVCNSCETLLIHADIAAQVLPELARQLIEKKVEIRGCNRTMHYIPEARAAVDLDWATEYLDLILAIKIVDSVADAIQHIRQYGSGHSEAIVTEHIPSEQAFISGIDAACVLVNASTRFVDGGEFGFGAEIGISTQKLHARGPFALKALTTTQYVVIGNGQIR